MSDTRFQHLLSKARDAKAGGRDAWSVQSTGEKLAVAMVLNRPDWIASMGYTLAEAIGRIDSDWLDLIPKVKRALEEE